MAKKNAVNEVKEIATMVTDSNEEDGLVTALSKIGPSQ